VTRAPPPTPRAEGLEQTIGERLRLGLEREAHARGAAGVGGELVDPERAHAVALAAAADLDDAMGLLDLGEGDVAPAEAIAGRGDAKARAGAETDGVLAREVPVAQVVVGELGVVREILQIVEDLLARRADDDRYGQGVQGGRKSTGGRRCDACRAAMSR
jgi:hypothetical protein